MTTSKTCRTYETIHKPSFGIMGKALKVAVNIPLAQIALTKRIVQKPMPIRTTNQAIMWATIQTTVPTTTIQEHFFRESI